MSPSRGITGDAPGRSSPRFTAAVVGPPLRREVYFALENDGWNYTLEGEVHVSASGVVREDRHHGPRVPFARRGAFAIDSDTPPPRAVPGVPRSPTSTIPRPPIPHAAPIRALNRLFWWDKAQYCFP